MRRFLDLSRLEKKKALEAAESEAFKMMILGKIDIPQHKIITGSQSDNLQDFIAPLIKEIAERAYYPDSEDVIINIEES